MTKLEKRAYAYAIERQKDPNYPTYNWETEISDAYEQGYKDAIDKACEWLKSNLYDYAGEDDKRNIVPFDSSVFEDFKKAMED